MVDASRTPVVVAVGQAIERDELVTNLDLAERAAVAALDGAGQLARRIQRVSMVGALVSPAGPRPASELAARLGLDPSACETTTTGGNTPQWLVTRAAEDIACGELAATLVAGAEAGRSHRAAGNAGPSPFNAGRGDRDAPGADPVVGGSDRGFLSHAEVNAGLIMPTTVYPAFDSALAAAAGRTFAEHRRALGAVMAPFTKVASNNAFAWFRAESTPDELADPAEGNRITSEPYTKRMNAFPFVDQAAALVVCSLEVARAAGLADRVVFVWAAGHANDVLLPVARPHLDRSPGIAAAARRALEAAGVGVDDVGAIDLYSCFPSAVEMGAAALGLALDDGRGFTVTGGLPYFGGPGNNYATHSIATMVELLRDRGGLGLCTALGGYVTKHAVGIYGTEPPPGGFRVADTAADQAAIDATALDVAADEADGPATVEANTMAYGPDGSVTSAPLIARLDDGRRVAAKADDAVLGAVAGQLLVGRRVVVSGSPPAWRFAD